MADEADTTLNPTNDGPPADATAVDAPAPAGDDTIDNGTALGDLKGEHEQPAAEVNEDDAAKGPPEAYELTPPEGFTLDKEALDEATPVFRDLGLDNEQAQKLVPVAAQFAARIRQQGEQQLMQHVMAERKAWLEEAKSDPEVGGENWDKSLHLAAKALDALPKDQATAIKGRLTDTGLGNHIDFVRVFAFFGKAISEDTDFVRADAAAPIQTNPARLMYPKDTPKGQ